MFFKNKQQKIDDAFKAKKYSKLVEIVKKTPIDLESKDRIIKQLSELKTPLADGALKQLAIEEAGSTAFIFTLLTARALESGSPGEAHEISYLFHQIKERRTGANYYTNSVVFDELNEAYLKISKPGEYPLGLMMQNVYEKNADPYRQQRDNVPMAFIARAAFADHAKIATNNKIDTTIRTLADEETLRIISREYNPPEFKEFRDAAIERMKTVNPAGAIYLMRGAVKSFDMDGIVLAREVLTLADTFNKKANEADASIADSVERLFKDVTSALPRIIEKTEAGMDTPMIESLRGFYNDAQENAFLSATSKTAIPFAENILGAWEHAGENPQALEAAAAKIANLKSIKWEPVSVRPPLIGYNFEMKGLR